MTQRETYHVKKFPDTARDIYKFVRDNTDERGNFHEDGVFGKLRTYTYSYWEGVWRGIGKPYSVTFELHKKIGRKRDNAYITLSQLDTAVNYDGKLFTAQELCEIAMLLDREVRKYEFAPTAFELWGDYPDIPYYISKNPKETLCNIVVTREEAERSYLSSDWCMTVSFADFLRLLKNEGVEIDCGW